MGLDAYPVIYFLYGLSFYSLAIALFIKRPPAPMDFMKPVLFRGGCFAALHATAEWLLMIYHLEGREFHIVADLSSVFASLSFIVFFSAALVMLGTRYQRLDRYHGVLVAVAMLIFVAAVYLPPDGINRFRFADALVRWTIGLPSALIMGYAIWQVLLLQKSDKDALDRFFPLLNRTRQIKPVLACIVGTTIMYGLTHLFGPTVEIGPFASINGDAFRDVMGFDIVLIRTAIAFLAAIFMIIGLRRLIEIERMELERRISDQTENLRAANELLSDALNAAHDAASAKSEFLASMSHELRTPLNAIIGYSQMLIAYDTASPEKRLERLGFIETSAMHLLALVDDVLNVTSIENSLLTLDCEHVDLVDLMGAVAAELQPLALQHGIALDHEIEKPDGDGAQGTALLVTADSTRLRQIMTNLVTNAIKYNSENGTVTLGFQAGPTGFVELWVRDTGPGIPDDKAETVFQMFQRAVADPYQAADGLGIGLALSKAYAEAMDGSIGFENLDTGCRFWVRLPQAD